MNTKNPAFGTWKKEELEIEPKKIFHKPIVDSKYASKLKSLESRLNTLFVKRQDGSIDIEDTNKRRENIVNKGHFPNNSKFYPEEHGFFYDGQGLLVYGQPTQE